MSKGTVKWFNPTKGYGFIQPQGGGGKDVFVHISAVERAGLSSLNEGQAVEYEIESSRGKESAINLKVKEESRLVAARLVLGALRARHGLDRALFSSLIERRLCSSRACIEKTKTPSWRPRPDAAQGCFQSRANPKRQIVGATTITAWCKQGPKRQDWLAAASGDDSRSRWGLRGVRSQKRPEAGQGAFTVSRLAVWPCARRACGPPAS